VRGQTGLSPCFLLGAGRSGTKFLRGMLGESKRVAEVPYDVGYVWRYGHESFPSDELLPEMANARVVNYVRNTLPKLVSADSNSEATILLEKSVPNSLRVGFLNAIYPEAKFIHLIRDGRAVVESSMRMWTSPAEPGYLLKKLRYFPWSNYRYAIWYLSNMIKGKLRSNRSLQVWGPRYKGIDQDLLKLPLEQVCARQWRRCVETSRDQLKEISPDRVFEVRYEDLVKDSSVLESICQFMGIDDISVVIDSYKLQASIGNVDKWKNNVEYFDFDVVLDEIGPLLEELGYSD